MHLHGPLARYLKLQVAHAPGMLGTFSLPPPVSDPDMHHGTCMTKVPWCMPGSLTSCFLWNRWRGNVTGIPGACATRNFTYLVRGPWLKYHCTGIGRMVWKQLQMNSNFSYLHLIHLRIRNLRLKLMEILPLPGNLLRKFWIYIYVCITGQGLVANWSVIDWRLVCEPFFMWGLNKKFVVTTCRIMFLCFIWQI